ncbi:V-type ATP synthase subunit D [Dactylosporangium sp. NPDC005555]|uniref:V-type ATP synthase subunit D n=1 Tax=Dactylosporangium sp. NPDC005555 TaxID=3154889 RepID=UPI0033AC9B59
MAGLRHVPAGRSGVLWLRHRLNVARRGGTVLRQKLTMLAGEQERLRHAHAASAGALRAADLAARTWLARAVLLNGADALDAACDVPPVSVTARWSMVMGVRYAEAPSVDLPPPQPQRAPAGGAAIIEAAAAYREAALAAARHAAAGAALRTVEAELATTRRRVRAIERHWVPRLESALATVSLQLAELEAGDAAGRRAAR